MEEYKTRLAGQRSERGSKLRHVADLSIGF